MEELHILLTPNKEHKNVFSIVLVAKFPTFRKQKPNIATGLTIIKVKIKHSGRVTKKFFRSVFTLTIVSMATVELVIGILSFLNNVKHMDS